MSDWVEWKWTAEKPYPETLDTELDMVRFRDGSESTHAPWFVRDWGGGLTDSNWEDTGHPDEIVAYKVKS